MASCRCASVSIGRPPLRISSCPSSTMPSATWERSTISLRPATWLERSFPSRIWKRSSSWRSQTYHKTSLKWCKVKQSVNPQYLHCLHYLSTFESTITLFYRIFLLLTYTSLYLFSITQLFVLFFSISFFLYQHFFLSAFFDIYFFYYLFILVLQLFLSSLPTLYVKCWISA